MNNGTKKQVQVRIRRVAGQLEGVARMIEKDRQCADVLVQISSAQAALDEAAKMLLRSHLEKCASDVLTTGSAHERTQKLDELTEAFVRYGCLGRRPVT